MKRVSRAALIVAAFAPPAAAAHPPEPPMVVAWTHGGGGAVRSHVPCAYSPSTKATDGCESSMDTPPAWWPYAYLNPDLLTTYPILTDPAVYGTSRGGWHNTSLQNVSTGYVSRPATNMCGSEFYCGVDYFAISGTFIDPISTGTVPTGCTLGNVAKQPPWIATPLKAITCSNDHDFEGYDLVNGQPGGIPVLGNGSAHTCIFRNTLIGPSPTAAFANQFYPIMYFADCSNELTLDHIWSDGGMWDYVNLHSASPGAIINAGPTGVTTISNSYLFREPGRFAGIGPNSGHCWQDLHLRNLVVEGASGTGIMHGDTTLMNCNGVAAKLVGGALDPSATLAALQAIPAGQASIRIGVDGFSHDATPHDYVGLDFHAVASLADAATVLQTAIRTYTQNTDIKVGYDPLALNFTVTSGTSGAMSQMTYATAAASGVDISGVLNLTSADAASLTTAGTAASGLMHYSATGLTEIQGGPHGGMASSALIVAENLSGNNPYGGITFSLKHSALIDNPFVTMAAGSMDATTKILTLTSLTAPANNPVNYEIFPGYSLVFAPGVGNLGQTASTAEATGFEGEYDLDPSGTRVWAGSPGKPFEDTFVGQTSGAIGKGYITDGGSLHNTKGLHLTLTHVVGDTAFLPGELITDSAYGFGCVGGGGSGCSTVVSALKMPSSTNDPLVHPWDATHRWTGTQSNGYRGQYLMVTAVTYSGTLSFPGSTAGMSVWIDARLGKWADSVGGPGTASTGVVSFESDDVTFDPTGSWSGCLTTGTMHGAATATNWFVMTTGAAITPNLGSGQGSGASTGCVGLWAPGS